MGDTKVPFCLQSCVKPLKYAIAVHDHGTEYVHRFIGKEPSGLRFNKLFLNEEGEEAAISGGPVAMDTVTRRVSLSNRVSLQQRLQLLLVSVFNEREKRGTGPEIVCFLWSLSNRPDYNPAVYF